MNLFILYLLLPLLLPLHHSTSASLSFPFFVSSSFFSVPFLSFSFFFQNEQFPFPHELFVQKDVGVQYVWLEACPTHVHNIACITEEPLAGCTRGWDGKQAFSDLLQFGEFATL